MSSIVIHIPRAEARSAVLFAPRSAIVSVEPAVDGRLTVDYEGAVYRQANLERYADRVAVAAGRALESYPTQARASVIASDLLSVAIFDPERGEVICNDPGTAEQLRDWLELDHLAESELQASGQRYELLRAAAVAEASGDARHIFAIRQLLRRQHEA